MVRARATSQWAAARATDERARIDSTKGLNARLDERRGVAWIANATTGNATRSRPRTSDREIETCAQCHARRSQIADGYEAGKPFLDYYRPALLSRPLYHADGQQRDEVYDLGVVPAEPDVRARRDVQRLPQSAQRQAARRRQCGVRDLSLAREVRHASAPSSSAGERGRDVRWLPHADHDLHGDRSASRSQPAHSPTGSLRHARHA